MAIRPQPDADMVMKIKRSVMKPIRWVVGRLRNRPDSEHQMSFNRLAFGAIIVVFLIARRNTENSSNLLTLMAIFITLALALFGHILFNPNISQIRRFLALLLDCGFLSWQLHLGGQGIALFFPIYLWVIFGNGFRFGINFLAISAMVAVFTFSSVVATTPFWYDQMGLSVGLMFGMIILPSYAGTLILKLSKATKIAEEANAAKDLFLANVSHELRTPLTAIVGMTGLLKSERLDPAQQEMVETIDVATRSLQFLISDLLDLSRIEAGRMPTSTEIFDLLDLLIDVRRMFDSQLKAKNLSINLVIMPHMPRHFQASRQYLEAILLNLVGNAVKFTETGCITVAVDAEKDDAQGDVVLKLAVSDTGIGIAPQDQGRIFENFTQANETIPNRFGGTGLGLAIARKFAVLMGGTISVESTLGKGSTFYVSIRAKIVGAETATEGAPENSLILQPSPIGFAHQSPQTTTTVESVPAEVALYRCRALVVDDNQVNLRVLSRILGSAGHDVLQAENGEQALDILEREGSSIDIVIMDFNMPKLDGLEATKLFRAMSIGDHRLPIVGLTADTAALSDGRWQEAGMDGCLLKPVEPAKFLATVETIARPTAQNSIRPEPRLVVALQEHQRFRVAGACALDETAISNLRLLGDSAFVDELLADFFLDATNIVDKLVQTAKCGISRAFHDHAHALRSAASNVGALALRDLGAPYTGLRASELQIRAAELSDRAQEDLWRTSEAIAFLRSSRRTNKA
jgi:signal transduction histidine kinase/DNA-binding response OmpR family regulator